MDNPIDVETLRATLRAMVWSELKEVALEAGLKVSTVDKIRRGLSREPGVFKVQALQRALEARSAKVV
jgi:transcriptional regulator with XRE-family HTH domain